MFVIPAENDLIAKLRDFNTFLYILVQEDDRFQKIICCKQGYWSISASWLPKNNFVLKRIQIRSTQENTSWKYAIEYKLEVHNRIQVENKQQNTS